ncbi:T9SS type A sorting domain-containing protein [Emticicia sp. C21]|uniref:T9SS type A sorting domain-containing protein n=1 Tax=Emticicia sp. C21 TaxID=2302915 RepID=UPI000E3459F6|nr:T9SS type A sorting domain-containing protein [Emticicia sp. C21]RFS17174.1 T9SS C-terminal target domain-containing protein [Emticicia sp. C21]
MKKQLLIIAIILFSLQAYADDKKIEYRSSNLNIAMYEYEHVNSLKLSLNILKDRGQKAKVKLMDAEGRTLHEEVIGRKLTSINVRLDLSTAPAGTYYVELTSGDRIITKEVKRDQHSLSY